MLRSRLNIFFAVRDYVESGSRRLGFASVRHDFTPDNYGFFDLNTSKEPPCQQDHLRRFGPRRAGLKIRPVPTPYSPHSSPLCRLTKGRLVRSCTAQRSATFSVGWDYVGLRSRRSTTTSRTGLRSIDAGARDIQRKSRPTRPILRRVSGALSGFSKIRATSWSPMGSMISVGIWQPTRTRSMLSSSLRRYREHIDQRPSTSPSGFACRDDLGPKSMRG